MTIKARPYMYDNGIFVTPRQLRQRYNTSNLDKLKKRFPNQFDKSRAPLLDSLLYCCRVRGATEVIPEAAMPRLHR